MAVAKMGTDYSSRCPQELHVLAVDDCLVDRKIIERLLKISCCEVTSVESGRRALQYLGLDGEKSSVGFDDLKVNLIMTDYSMPGMTGFELLKKIKGSSKLREIPVVIMSSENILARIDRCLEEGAEDFLVKPVKLSDVQRLKDFILKGEEKNAREITLKRKMNDGLFSPLPASTPPPSPSLNCETSLSPMLVSAKPHQLLAKHPSLMSDDSFSPLPASPPPPPPPPLSLNCESSLSPMLVLAKPHQLLARRPILMSDDSFSPLPAATPPPPLSLNCESSLSPMLVSAKPHQLLAKRPSLMSDDSFSPLPASPPPPPPPPPLSLNCESSLSPMLVSAKPHQLLARRPSLMSDDSFSPLPASTPPPLSLNCESSLSPMLVSAKPHQLLAKRPSLMIASD